ncbi:MAG TPA: M56 family metallopeptidase, partial [Spirochaetia bacterium]|nr:M56 family metallopeptidase [Spirochaetia bacterium]
MDPLVLQAAVRLSCKLLPVLLAASVKVSVLLAFALAGAWLMRGTRPALRRGMWLAAMGGSLVVFLLSLHGPLFLVIRPPGRNGGALASVVSAAVLPPAHPLAASGGMPGLAAELWRRASSGRPWIDAWPLLVLFLWLAGVLSGWLAILWSRFQLLVMTRESTGPAGKRYQGLARALCRRVGIRRGVRIVESSQCPTPLTLGVVRPAIVLPASMQSWSAAGKRYVLFHELNHVRSGDSFLLGIAYAICSLFWFIPLVWAAYARLYLEQEKACDAVVLESGAEPQAYASCILDTALFSREPALPAGMSFSGRRKRVLNNRIMSIVRGRKTQRHGALLFCFAALMLGAITMMSVSGLVAPGQAQKKYGNVALAEYRGRTPDETAIVAMLVRYESAFNAHDLPALLSLFARGA